MTNWSVIAGLVSPKRFFKLAGQVLPGCWLVVVVSLGYGLVDGLVLAPPDYQQGDAYRIMYLHVPSAILSLAIFTVIAVASASYLIWRVKIADVIASVGAPIGAGITMLALITGSLWGKPMWGTYWIWDARLTSELILLFLYLGLIALRKSIPNETLAAKACGLVAIIGVIDIPIIHYSVNWWNTLHQSASFSLFTKPTIAPAMLVPLCAMLVAFLAYAMALGLMNARTEILKRESRAYWVKNYVSDA